MVGIPKPKTKNQTPITTPAPVKRLIKIQKKQQKRMEREQKRRVTEENEQQ